MISHVIVTVRPSTLHPCNVGASRYARRCLLAPGLRFRKNVSSCTVLKVFITLNMIVTVRNTTVGPPGLHIIYAHRTFPCTQNVVPAPIATVLRVVPRGYTSTPACTCHNNLRSATRKARSSGALCLTKGLHTVRTSGGIWPQAYLYCGWGGWGGLRIDCPKRSTPSRLYLLFPSQAVERFDSMPCAGTTLL